MTDIYDHYWITADKQSVYSTKYETWMSSTDPRYQAWVTEWYGRAPTPYHSREALAGVLAQYGLYVHPMTPTEKITVIQKETIPQLDRLLLNMVAASANDRTEDAEEIKAERAALQQTMADAIAAALQGE